MSRILRRALGVCFLQTEYRVVSFLYRSRETRPSSRTKPCLHCYFSMPGVLRPASHKTPLNNLSYQLVAAVVFSFKRVFLSLVYFLRLLVPGLPSEQYKGYLSEQTPLVPPDVAFYVDLNFHHKEQ